MRLWYIKSLLQILIFLSSSAYGAPATIAFSEQEIAILTRDVQVKNWNWSRKNRLFSSPQLKKIPSMIKLNVTKPIIPKPEHYKKFYTGESISSAVTFSRKWRSLLKRASKKYDVDAETIVSVMLVETKLGRYTGKYQVLAVFASTYVDAKQALASAKLTPKMSRRVQRKMQWALGEMQALLKMKHTHGTDILSLKGSYAGAFGLCQFLPSSFMAYAVKGIGKGSPNLYYEPDAIFSVANYLSTHGYRQGNLLQSKKNRRAVHRYNNSDVYVDAVLGVAAHVRETL